MPDSSDPKPPASPRGTITLLLDAIARGHPEKEEELYLIVYQELHDIAAAAMKRERRDHTLQTTALIHEVYLRLMNDHDSDRPATSPTFTNRGHFFASAARAMRRILVEHARTNHSPNALSESGLPLAPPISGFDHLDLLALDEALLRLEARDERMCRIVELRFFAHMTMKQIARILGVSSRQVDRDWKAAKSWLHREIE